MGFWNEGISMHLKLRAFRNSRGWELGVSTLKCEYSGVERSLSVHSLFLYYRVYEKPFEFSLFIQFLLKDSILFVIKTAK